MNKALTLFITLATIACTVTSSHAGDIFLAIADDNFEEVKRLIQANPNCVNQRDHKNSQPIHLVKSISTAKLLMLNGADPKAINNHDTTPLHWAQSGAIANLLLLNGANPNALNNSNTTPLHLAINSEISELIILHGADLNALNNSNETPLHWAGIYDGTYDMINTAKLLIQNGANINAIDKYNNTPANFAESQNLKKLFSDLDKLQKSAKKLNYSRLFFTAIRNPQYLQKNKIPLETVELLVKNMVARGTVDIITAYPSPNAKLFALFNTGRLPVLQLKKLIANLSKTLDETELWKVVAPFYKRWRTSYQCYKNKRYQQYGRVMRDRKIMIGTLTDQPFELDTARIITQYC
jgi:hypothetical protein